MFINQAQSTGSHKSSKVFAQTDEVAFAHLLSLPGPILRQQTGHDAIVVACFVDHNKVERPHLFVIDDTTKPVESVTTTTIMTPFHRQQPHRDFSKVHLSTKPIMMYDSHLTFEKNASICPLMKMEIHGLAKMKSIQANASAMGEAAFSACRNGDVNRLGQVIEETHGKCLTWRNANGQTCLEVVCENGKEKCLDKLVEAGVLVEETNPLTGNSGLHYAAFHGHVGICKKFMEKNESLLLQCNEFGETPLYLGCKYGHLKVVKALLNARNADKQMKLLTNDQKSASDVAKEHGHNKIVTFLSKRFP